MTPGRLADTGYPHTENPFGIAGARRHSQTSRTSSSCIVRCGDGRSAPSSLVIRYRRSHGVERLQLKWLTAAAAGGRARSTRSSSRCRSAIIAMSADPPTWLTVLQEVRSLLLFVLIPLAIGIAMLRYRLYDIDVIIRRTLVYTALVGALARASTWAGSPLVGAALRAAHRPVRAARRHALDPRRGGRLPAAAARASSTRVDRRFYRAPLRRRARARARSRRSCARRSTSTRSRDELLVDGPPTRCSPRTRELWLRAVTIPERTTGTTEVT